MDGGKAGWMDSACIMYMCQAEKLRNFWIDVSGEGKGEGRWRKKESKMWDVKKRRGSCLRHTSKTTANGKWKICHQRLDSTSQKEICPMHDGSHTKWYGSYGSYRSLKTYVRNQRSWDKITRPSVELSDRVSHRTRRYVHYPDDHVIPCDETKWPNDQFSVQIWNHMSWEKMTRQSVEQSNVHCTLCNHMGWD